MGQWFDGQRFAAFDEYASPVGLLACPFCREMFAGDEHEQCPVCGVALRPFEKLPPSHEAEAEDGLTKQPEHELLPATYFGRGRGALVILAAIGLALFFLPWIHTTMPDILTLNGFTIARRIGWVWSAGVAWVVLVPTVLSRRTIAQLRGARVAAAFLSAMPATSVLILLLRQPHGAHGVPLRFTFEWPMYAALAVSLVALVFSVRLGGRVDVIQLRRGTSQGQIVH
jgi:hypothetical protein